MPNLDLLQCYMLHVLFLTCISRQGLAQVFITRRTGMFGVFEWFSCVRGLPRRKSDMGKGSRMKGNVV